MQMENLKQKKRELIASQVSQTLSETNENLLRVNLGKFFADLEAEIQKGLVEYWSDTGFLNGQLNIILSPIHEKHQEYYDLILSHKQDEYERGAMEGRRLVKRAKKQYAMKSAHKSAVTFTHNKNKPLKLFGTKKYSQNRLEKDTFVATQKTLDRVDGNINTILSEGYKSGKGINHVSKQISERFDQLKTWESKRIARTEIHTAHQLGIMKSYEEMGVQYKQWMSAHDSRVRGRKKKDRADHVKLDGEITPMDASFSNKLEFAGDKSGKIEEWINCRCATAPFIMPPNKIAPPHAPFKESDLITVNEPNYDELLINATGGKLDYNSFVASLVGKMNPIVSVGTGIDADDAPTPEYIDEDALFLAPIDENSKGDYYLDISGDDITVVNGKGYYKGLELIDWTGAEGFLTKEDIALHNKQFETKTKEYIDVDALIESGVMVESSSGGAYLIYDENSIIKNPNTGKYEYKGLEMAKIVYHKGTDDFYYAKVQKTKLEEFNKQFKEAETKASESVSVEDKDIISAVGLTHDGNYSYFVNSKTEGFELKNGEAYYKGIELDFYDESTDFGYITESTFDHYNTNVLYGEDMPTVTETQQNLTPEEQTDFDQLKSILETNIEFLSSPYIQDNSKLESLKLIKKYLPKFRELQAKAKNTPKIEGEYIDVVELTASTQFNSLDNGGQLYIVTKENQIAEINGKAFYKGLEIKDYNSEFGFGHITQAEIAEHNLKYPKAEPMGEYIYESTLFEWDADGQGDYAFVESELTYNSTTGKYEYKGMEMDTYNPDNSMGFVFKETVEKHNNQFDSSADISKEFIEIGDLIVSNSEKYKGFYRFDKTDLTFNQKTGKYYYKGLEVDYMTSHGVGYLSKSSIDKHNASVQLLADLNSEVTVVNETPKKEYIELDDFYYNSDEGYYVIPKKELVYDEVSSEYYYKGAIVNVNINPNTGKVLYGKLSKLKMKVHNKAFKPKTELIDVSELQYDDINHYYMVDAENLSKIGSKYYYKGLEVDDVVHSSLGEKFAKISEKKIYEHNKQQAGKSLDPTELLLVEDGDPNAGQYYIDSEYGEIKLNPETGKYELTEYGIELDTYNPDYDEGYISHETLTEHNVKVYDHHPPELIDTTDLVENMFYEGYNIGKSNPDLVLNPATGKYEYKGLELDKSYDDYGVIFKKSVVTHNNKLKGVKATTDLIEQTKADLVTLDGLIENPSGDTFIVDPSLVKITDTGAEYKGIDLDIYYTENGEPTYILSQNDVLNKNKKTVFKVDDLGDIPTYFDAFDVIPESKALAYEDAYQKVNSIIEEISTKELHPSQKTAYLNELEENLKIVYEEIPKIKPPEMEYIDDSAFLVVDYTDGNLTKVGYHVTKEDGIFEYYGKYYYKGLEVVNYNPLTETGVIPKYGVYEHNLKIETKDWEIIDPEDLFESNGGFAIDEDEGAIYKGDDKWEFKGEIFESSEGHWYLQIDMEAIVEHNEKIIKAKDTKPVSNIKKEYINADDLSDTGYDEYVVEKYFHEDDMIYDPNTNAYYYKGLELDGYDFDSDQAYITKQQIQDHNEAIQNEKAKYKYIDMDDLVYFESEGGYLIDKLDGLEFNSETGKYEYNGLEIDANTVQFEDGDPITYLSEDTIKKHNQNIEPTIEEIEALDIDTDEDYLMYEDEHGKDIYYDEETDEYYWKGVKLASYDGDEGYIEKGVMQKFIQDHNIRPETTGYVPNRVEFVENENVRNITGSNVLEETTNSDGERCVLDEKRDEYIIDDKYSRTYEREQDRIQDSNANYTSYEFNSVEHWGRYGHQHIGNLIYGDTDYSDWGRYAEFMETKAIPLLDDMKGVLELFYDENATESQRNRARRKYQRMEGEFEELVNTIHDSEVRNTLWEIKDLDSAIAKTPTLIEDLVMVRYGHFDEDMCEVGKIFDLEGFLSISYDDLTQPAEATEHFANKKCSRWKITVLAPKGTKGIRLNSFFNALTSEREWLLQRNQRFEVVEYNLEDYDDWESDCKRQGIKRRRVTIRLID